MIDVFKELVDKNEITWISGFAKFLNLKCIGVDFSKIFGDDYMKIGKQHRIKKTRRAELESLLKELAAFKKKTGNIQKKKETEEKKKFLDDFVDIKTVFSGMSIVHAEKRLSEINRPDKITNKVLFIFFLLK